MENDDALAGDYAMVMLAVVACWIVLIAGGVAFGSYLALERLV